MTVDIEMRSNTENKCDTFYRYYSYYIYMIFFDQMQKANKRNMPHQLEHSLIHLEKLNETTMNKKWSMWNKVRLFFSQESYYEKKLHDRLEKLAEDHPLISGIIIAVLTGVVLSLIEDCIHDAL